MPVFYIGSDNSVILDKLADDANGQYINDADLSFTLYRQRAQDGVMTVGSASLSSDTAAFVAGDVGKSIIVPGAGPYGSDLQTTISAVVSATQATLAAAASTAVTYAHFLVSIPDAKDITMDYVASSNGRYIGILQSTVTLGLDTYTLVVDIDGGIGRIDQRQVQLPAVYRG